MSRRSRPPVVPARVIAAGLVAAFALGAFGLAAAPAYAVPDAPTITSPAESLDTVGPDVTIAGTLAAPSGYDYVRVQWRTGGLVADECFTGLAPGDSTFSCTSAVPAPGIYSVVAQHADVAEPGESDWSASSNAVTVIVGNQTPVTITNFGEFDNIWATRTPTIEGVGPAFGSISVQIFYGDESLATYCTVAQIPASGIWSCTGSTSGPWGSGLTAFRADGFDATGAPTTPDSGDFISGIIAPPAPVITYTFGPASIGISIEDVDGSYVKSELYEIEVIPGEPYQYGFPVETCFPDEGSASASCSYSELAPGIWNFFTTRDVSESFYLEVDEYVRIPESPTEFTATVNADRSVTFSGLGTSGDRAIVGGPGGNTVCSAIVAGSGSWQCTASPAAGIASYQAVQQSVGFVADPPFSPADRSLDGISAETSALSVTVPAAPPVVPPSPAPTKAPPVVPPSVTPTPVPWTLEGYDGGTLTPGQTLNLSAQGLPSGTSVVVEIRSTPQVLGTAIADALGAFALAVTIPADLEPGGHTLVAIATPPGGVASTVAIPVVVEAAAPPAESETSGDAGGQPTAAASGDEGADAAVVDRSNPAAPSAISDQIPTIDRIVRTPLLLVAAGGLALAILLLVAFPAELLNSTLASNTRRIGRWYAAIDASVERATEWFAAVTRTRALAAALLVVVTSLGFGFIDPNYGFDPVSLRMTFSLAIGLFIVTYVSSWISGAIITRLWQIPTRISLQPAALVFAVVGVIVARLLEFSPGFLIGLVIGLDLLTRVGAPHRVRATLTNIGVIVGLAVLAWVGFSIMTALVTGEPTMVGLLVSDALVATTSEGLTAALAALMPLGFLQGHEIFRHSKRLWAATFAVVGTIFALIVLPTAGTGPGDAADIGFWILVMAVFAAVTLSLWAVLHFTGDRDIDDESDVKDPLEAARS